MYNYKLKACRRCGGDLARDESDWICLQCGSYSYVGLYSDDSLPLATLAERRGDFEAPDESLQANRKGATDWGNRDVMPALSGFARAGGAQPALLLTGAMGLMWTAV